MVTHDYLINQGFKFRKFEGEQNVSTAGEYVRDDLQFLMRVYKFDEEPDCFKHWEITIITKFRKLVFTSKCPNKDLTIENLNLLVRLITN
jgi:hypothetical protein